MNLKVVGSIEEGVVGMILPIRLRSSHTEALLGSLEVDIEDEEEVELRDADDSIAVEKGGDSPNKGVPLNGSRSVPITAKIGGEAGVMIW